VGTGTQAQAGNGREGDTVVRISGATTTPAQSRLRHIVGRLRPVAARLRHAIGQLHPDTIAVGRALLAWFILCAGVAIAVTLARFFGERFDLDAAAVAVVQAILASALVVPAIVALRRWGDRAPLRGLGLSRSVLRPALIGAAVGLGLGVLVWAPAALLGWIEIGTVDPLGVATFLVANAAVLVLYEALPEELALRGYAWTHLSERWKPLVATLAVTAIFPLSTAAISVLQAVVSRLIGIESLGLFLVPPRMDPIAYGLQLVFFGLALGAARRIPLEGALTIAISFHLCQLTVNRLLLGGSGWLDSGVGVRFMEPDAIALVLVHIILSGIAFVLIRKRLERHQRADRLGHPGAA
jgi:membrane protease YdiL (CAAX protease family)